MIKMDADNQISFKRMSTQTQISMKKADANRDKKIYEQ